MTKESPEIVQLRLDIEARMHHKIHSPYEFDCLAGAIWERLHENISPTTLKRLWGYIDGAEVPRWGTLSLLSRFLGFNDWEHYVRELYMRDDVESEIFRGKGILVNQLQKGDIIEVTWLPNRFCRFRYDGEHNFTVIASKNAKLHEGDTFSAAAFFIGKPMYLDNLRDGTSYVAGKRNGILTAKKL